MVFLFLPVIIKHSSIIIMTLILLFSSFRRLFIHVFTLQMILTLLSVLSRINFIHQYWEFVVVCLLDIHIHLYQEYVRDTSSNIPGSTNFTGGILWLMIFPLFNCFKWLVSIFVIDTILGDYTFLRKAQVWQNHLPPHFLHRLGSNGCDKIVNSNLCYRING